MPRENRLELDFDGAGVTTNIGPQSTEVYGEGQLRVTPLEKFTASVDCEPYVRLSVQVDDGAYDYEECWGSAGVSLSREQARELGQWLTEQADRENPAVFITEEEETDE